ncbi:MAG: spore germination protein amino acid permease [Eubacterium sp.]|jgi:spore germination protein KB|nr:spore germination protein amino acid permease [Eubacterium sp.]
MDIEKGKIDGIQLIFLTAGFIHGSILLISYISGISESQTWLVILAAMIFIAPFIFLYVSLAKRFPGMNFVQINDVIYGSLLGKIISIYFIFFIFMTLSFNIRDIGSFYTNYLMPDTPMIFFLVIFSGVLAYAVTKGIEVLARVSHLLVFVMIFFAISTTLLLADKWDFSNFLPVLEISPIKFIHATHIMSSIPFGEMIIFLMIFSSLNKTEHMLKNTYIGMIIGTFSLFIVAVRNTAVLGNTQTIWTSTSFQATRLVDIGTILTRLDILIAIGQTISMFLKSSLFFYALVLALSQLLRLKSYLPLVLPLAGILVVMAATVFQSPIDQLMISVNAGIIYSVPLMYILPLISLIVAKIRGLPKFTGEKKQ